MKLTTIKFVYNKGNEFITVLEARNLHFVNTCFNKYLVPGKLVPVDHSMIYEIRKCIEEEKENIVGGRKTLDEYSYKLHTTDGIPDNIKTDILVDNDIIRKRYDCREDEVKLVKEIIQLMESAFVVWKPENKGLKIYITTECDNICAENIIEEEVRKAHEEL